MPASNREEVEYPRTDKPCQHCGKVHTDDQKPCTEAPREEAK